MYYSRLAEHPRQSTPEVWGRLAGCHQALGSYDAAVGIFLKILGGQLRRMPVHASRSAITPESLLEVKLSLQITLSVFVPADPFSPCRRLSQ